VVSARIAECDTPPLIPVTVIVEFPIKVDLLYAEVSVSVEVPKVDVVTEVGERMAVTPAGCPLTERATVPENPNQAEISTE
jgi:hypothetical protein